MTRIFQVFHSGIPITLVPLDATNTIPINEEFFDTFEKTKRTYEAQYVFQSLKMARDTWFDDQFYTVVFSLRWFLFRERTFFSLRTFFFYLYMCVCVVF